ncbi:MAG: phosphoribosylformylglycinamidine cyclo-ligase [Planctomycetota bacterium]
MHEAGEGEITYRQAGVDIDSGGEVVKRIARWVRSTHNPHVLPHSHGSFGGFFRLFGGGLFDEAIEDPVLVAATDGVGTKLRVAFEMGRADTVGIDLVAMCVNDLVVSGARPLFFLDYVAAAAIDPAVVEEIVQGIAEGCKAADCALLGGETAEMPGFYRPREFDLAGFTVGLVERARIIDGSAVSPGDAVVGLSSSGLHSNGYSLARRALLEGKGRRSLGEAVDCLGRTLGEELLEPTKIYARPLLSLLQRFREKRPVRAAAHITGGGLVENIPRVLPVGLGVALRRSAWERPPVFELIEREGPVGADEMDRVFNQGLGMVLIVSPSHADGVVEHLRSAGEEASIVGEVTTGGGGVRFTP